jgi:N-methylhydantoinase A
MRDVLEIRRAHRLADPYNLYNLQQELPKPFVPRRLRKEVRERIDRSGVVIEPLNEEDVRRVARELKQEGVDSIAIVFLFSFFNSAHEEHAAEIVHEEFPEAFITTSSSLAPLIREYERTSTTAANAYTTPLFSKYQADLSKDLSGLSYKGKLSFIQSNGGLCTAEVIQDRFINTLLAGPAAGVVGALYISKMLGYKNILSFDMGGTSCEICFIHDGKADIKLESNVAEHAISLPMLDIETIGQGGASIAWVDSGGAIRIGPRSAPPLGAVSYQMGGKEPTVTDVDLTLGYINPKHFLNGEMEIDVEATISALQNKICKPVSMDSVEQSAASAFDIANALMVGAIREKAIQKGHDPVDFTLVAYGGCGPIHAPRLASLLGISKVIVPVNAGAFSAFGLLAADIQHSYVKALLPVKDIDIDYINAAYEEIRTRGRKLLERQGIPADRRLVHKSIGLRYASETHEVIVPVHEDVITNSILEALKDAFHNEHKRCFGHKMLDEPVIVVSLYLDVVGLLDKPLLPEIRSSDANSLAAIKSQRMVYFPDEGQILTPIYDRTKLLSDNLIKGPALIEEPYSTTVLLPGQKAKVDKYGNIVIEVHEK